MTLAMPNYDLLKKIEWLKDLQKKLKKNKKNCSELKVFIFLIVGFEPLNLQIFQIFPNFTLKP